MSILLIIVETGKKIEKLVTLLADGMDAIPTLILSF